MLYWISLNGHTDLAGVNEAKNAKTIYKKQIRRYLGMGFILSFIPGTDAFLARETLLTNIEHLESKKLFWMEELPWSDESENDLIPWFMKSPLHIIIRTFLAITHHNYEDSFESIFFGQNIGSSNRLNPFLYPAQLVVLILKAIRNNHLFYRINSYFGQFILILQIPAYAVIFIALGVAFSIAFSILIPGIVLYFVTELLLNSLNTLLIEPFKFVYEVLNQLVTNWYLDFAYMPTDDYNKVSKILAATDKKLIDDAIKNNSLNIYLTEELTLIESTEKIIDSMEKLRNSFFYKINQDKDLFIKSDPEILSAFNELENLRTFSYFTHKEMPNLFDKALTQKIIDTCQNLDSHTFEPEEITYPYGLFL